MKVLDITHDSIVDGEGLRTVIWFAGCQHKCKGCHNPQSWDINNGQEMTIDEILEEIKSNQLITGVTFSGGCPMFQAKDVAQLAIKIKELGLNIWTYTGFTLEEIINEGTLDMKILLELSDVVVDGRFEEEQKNLSLAFKGSRNQRILRRGEDY